jgi:hypothetical protein
MGPTVQHGPWPWGVDWKGVAKNSHQVMLSRTVAHEHRPLGVFASTDGYLPIGMVQSIMLSWNTEFGAFGMKGAGIGFRRN